MPRLHARLPLHYPILSYKSPTFRQILPRLCKVGFCYLILPIACIPEVLYLSLIFSKTLRLFWSWRYPHIPVIFYQLISIFLTIICFRIYKKVRHTIIICYKRCQICANAKINFIHFFQLGNIYNYLFLRCLFQCFI